QAAGDHSLARGAGEPDSRQRDGRWLKSELVGHLEFVEWTGESHLWHSRFVALRDDERPPSRWPQTAFSLSRPRRPWPSRRIDFGFRASEKVDLAQNLAK